MTVDFSYARAPAIRLAYIAWKGPWSEAKIRGQFGAVAEWAKEQRLRTGRWVFREPADGSFEVGIEVKGRATGHGRIRLKTVPAATVAHIVFDPDQVSPRVVYHGLYDWLRAQRREGEIKSIGSYWEVYTGDPWKDARAWRRTEVRAVVRR